MNRIVLFLISLVLFYNCDSNCTNVPKPKVKQATWDKVYVFESDTQTLSVLNPDPDYEYKWVSPLGESFDGEKILMGPMNEAYNGIWQIQKWYGEECGFHSEFEIEMEVLSTSCDLKLNQLCIWDADDSSCVSVISSSRQASKYETICILDFDDGTSARLTFDDTLHYPKIGKHSTGPYGANQYSFKLYMWPEPFEYIKTNGYQDDVFVYVRNVGTKRRVEFCGLQVRDSRDEFKPKFMSLSFDYPD